MALTNSGKSFSSNHTKKYVNITYFHLALEIRGVLSRQDGSWLYLKLNTFTEQQGLGHLSIT